MFIYNLKINGSLWFRILIVFSILIAIVVCALTVYKIYNASITKVNDDIVLDEFKNVDNKNYANILQAVHNNIDLYVGKKIKYSGFIYRVYDLNNEQFVLGRNMIISSDFQTVVVGFLCHYKDSIKYKDSTWVELEGKITKGTYHNQSIPILEVISIKEINKPDDEYVFPPDENYIPTSFIL